METPFEGRWKELKSIKEATVFYADECKCPQKEASFILKSNEKNTLWTSVWLHCMRGLCCIKTENKKLHSWCFPNGVTEVVQWL